MNQRTYTLTMLGALIGYGVLSHAIDDPATTLVLAITAIVISVSATVVRARDANANPTLWAFLVFLPFAWIVLATKPSLGVRIV